MHCQIFSLLSVFNLYFLFERECIQSNIFKKIQTVCQLTLVALHCCTTRPQHKGIIKETVSEPVEFVSLIVTVDKSDGGIRLTLNLKT